MSEISETTEVNKTLKVWMKPKVWILTLKQNLIANLKNIRVKNVHLRIFEG